MRVRGDAQQDRCSRGQRSSSIWRLTKSGAGHRPGGYIRRRRANVRDGSASGTLKLRNLSSELGPTSEDDDASRDCDFPATPAPAALVLGLHAKTTGPHCFCLPCLHSSVSLSCLFLFTLCSKTSFIVGGKVFRTVSPFSESRARRPAPRFRLHLSQKCNVRFGVSECLQIPACSVRAAMQGSLLEINSVSTSGTRIRATRLVFVARLLSTVDYD